ncbi:MAG: hypothetical protein KDE04_18320, partial [Anaerolineales bacterium]|nr:hypothetical protein [Anaerolineales bacterium]
MNSHGLLHSRLPTLNGTHPLFPPRLSQSGRPSPCHADGACTAPAHFPLVGDEAYSRHWHHFAATTFATAPPTMVPASRHHFPCHADGARTAS